MATAEYMNAPERPSEILYTAEAIQGRIDQLAVEIPRYYYGNARSMPPIITLLEGGKPFAQDLNTRWREQWDDAFPIHYLHAHSYDGDQSTGTLKVDYDSLDTFGVEEAPEVLILDDVLDSGLTIGALQDILRERYNVRRVDVGVLVDKLRINRPRLVRPRFTGFVTDPTHWIFGYGMDDGQNTAESEQARALPYIARFV